MKYSDRLYLIFFLSLGVIYIQGLFIPLMNNDSAHHANIALHMYLTGDYVSLIDQGKDYLDKPHLLFWLVTVSYHIFGVTTFAYKFPSLLFTLAGLYATYRLARLLYNATVGKLAALVLASSLAFVLANNDVRMDAILTACIALASWQLAEYITFRRWSNVLFASLGLALAFATKGMSGVAVPLIAAFGFLIHKKSLAVVRDFKWIAIPFFFFLFISPVLYSYYQQFDLHPEKVIRNHAGVSGVEFILWSQNVERFDGSNFGGKSASRDHFFFLHTMLWAFLPWSILLVLSFGNSLKHHISNRFRFGSKFDGLTLIVISVVMLILSFSGYKLPHYLNILFPFFAILTSAYILDPDTRRNEKTVLRIQGVIVVLMVLLAVMLNGWSLPMNSWALILCVAVFAAVSGLAWMTSVSAVDKAVSISLTGALFFNFLLNFNWYPKLLNYQAGSTLAKAVMDGQEGNYFFLEGAERSSSFEFYKKRLIPAESIQSLSARPGPVRLYTGSRGLELLQENHARVKVIATAPDYSVSKLRTSFLDPRRRPELLSKRYLVEVYFP